MLRRIIKTLWCMILNVLLICTGVCSFAMTAHGADDETQNTYQSPSYILMEASTGKVLMEYNADEQRKPASVTKVMTMLLIFEAIDAGEYTYDDIVTVSAHAASMGGSQCFFEQGEQQTVSDMIKCIAVASGNDAAVAMAEYTAGSEEAFVDLMNEKAKELGMENTHFVNACGLDADGHVTSSRDIAIMSRELIMYHPDVLDYCGIWMDSIIHKTARGESQFDLANTNKFLNMYTGATGLKTGYTATAKYCMSATATRDGVTLIAVIMGAETKDIRNGEACSLLDYGFAMCRNYRDENVLTTESVPVINGTAGSVKIKTSQIFEAVLLKGEDEALVQKELVLFGDVVAPLKENASIGYIEYTVDGRTIGAVEVLAAEDVARMTFGYAVKHIFANAFFTYNDK